MEEFYFIPHPKDIWVVATKTGETLFKIRDLYHTNGKQNTEDFIINKDLQNKVIPISDKKVLQGVDNICTLTEISDASALHTLRVRYMRNDIYTNVGRIVLSLNPFNYLLIYGKSVIDKYNSSDPYDLPPHIFQVAAAAYKGLKDLRKPQSILITGESGSGKTESTKLVLKFMAEVGSEARRKSLASLGESNSSKMKMIEQRILEANPILESFGNSTTLRNPNSSRFGKWLEIFFNDNLQVSGARFTSYLLELPRLTKHICGERSYHVFYQIFAASKGDMMKMNSVYELGEDFLSFNYLNPSKIGKEKHEISFFCVNDIEGFQQMKQALSTLEFLQNEQDDLFMIVAGILHLGNCSFSYKQVKNSDGSALNSNCLKHLAAASEFFGITTKSLEDTLTFRVMVTTDEAIKIPLTPLEAEVTRDSFVKFLYGILFKWLICKINKNLEPQPGAYSSSNFIGILDIAGFECFQVNSYEQLCINLSNEKLQYLFNEDVFLSVVEDYKKEGLKSLDLTYQDNALILELIEGKNGLIDLLDEELFIPSGSDAGYINKIHTKHQNHKHFIASRIRSKNQFGIRHYAGDVTYTVHGWLDKNRFVVSKEALGCLRSSTKDLIQKILEVDNSLQKEKNTKSFNSRITVGKKFKNNLSDLMRTLKMTDAHYVRCVKPNTMHKAQVVDSEEILRQLVCSGVIDAIKIYKSGFPFRQFFKDFVDRYSIILIIEGIKITEKEPKEASKNLISHLLSKMCIDKNTYVMGSSKVFMKDIMYSSLEKLRSMALRTTAIIIQSAYRGHRVRLRYKIIFEIDRKLKEYLNVIPKVIQNEGLFLYPNAVFVDANDPFKLRKKASNLTDLIKKAKAQSDLIQFNYLEKVIKLQAEMEHEASILIKIHTLLNEKETNIARLEEILHEALKNKIKNSVIEELSNLINKLKTDSSFHIENNEDCTKNDKKNIKSSNKKSQVENEECNSGLGKLMNSSCINLSDNEKYCEEAKKKNKDTKKNSKKLSKLDTLGMIETKYLPLEVEIKEKTECRGDETESSCSSVFSDSSDSEYHNKMNVLSEYTEVSPEKFNEESKIKYLQKFAEELNQAVKEFDVDQIKFLVRKAEESQLEKNLAELELAKSALVHIEDPEWITSELREAVVFLTHFSPSETQIKRLINLIEHARLLNVDQKDIKIGEAILKFHFTSMHNQGFLYKSISIKKNSKLKNISKLKINYSILTCKIWFFDGTRRSIRISLNASFDSLCAEISNELNISSLNDWMLVDRIRSDAIKEAKDVIEPPNAFRLFAENETLMTLKKFSLKEVEVVFCRKVISSQDDFYKHFIDAYLTYKQAVYEYYRYPIIEDLELLCQINAKILVAENDFKDIQDVNFSWSVIKGYIPMRLKKLYTRDEWISGIRAMIVANDFKSHKLMRMNSVLHSMKSLKVFNGFFWLCDPWYLTSREIFKRRKLLKLLKQNQLSASRFVLKDITSSLDNSFVKVLGHPSTFFNRRWFYLRKLLCRKNVKIKINRNPMMLIGTYWLAVNKLGLYLFKSNIDLNYISDKNSIMSPKSQIHTWRPEMLLAVDHHSCDQKDVIYILYKNECNAKKIMSFIPQMPAADTARIIEWYFPHLAHSDL